MSLALRFGTVASIQEALWGVVPRLPSITIRLGLQNRLGNQSTTGERLQELKEKIDNSLNCRAIYHNNFNQTQNISKDIKTEV